MTTVSSGSSLAMTADWPCGRARKTTSCPASVSAVVSSSTRSASGTRCGWSRPSGSPALEPAVTAPISTSGCASSRRSTSPPAYPLAPATAAFGFVMTHDYTEVCMDLQTAETAV